LDNKVFDITDARCNNEERFFLVQQHFFCKHCLTYNVRRRLHTVKEKAAVAYLKSPTFEFISNDRRKSTAPSSQIKTEFS